MMARNPLLLLAGWLLSTLCTYLVSGSAAPPAPSATCPSVAEEPFSYVGVFDTQRSAYLNFQDLPGFTRSVYERDHALVTPESRVWAGLVGWNNTFTAHIISRANGANFAMYLADMQPGSNTVSTLAGTERFVLVISGAIDVFVEPGPSVSLGENDFAYFPPDSNGLIQSHEGAGLLIYERIYALGGSPQFIYGNTDEQDLLPVPGEVFRLRKLLPPTPEYDFNVHVMDFSPGEYLYVKEVHYNQHGLLLLDGQGIYRLGNNWYPVQAGDAIWMGPFVLQWYAALGPNPTRYVIYKDTILDPLLY